MPESFFKIVYLNLFILFRFNNLITWTKFHFLLAGFLSCLIVQHQIKEMKRTLEKLLKFKMSILFSHQCPCINFLHIFGSSLPRIGLHECSSRTWAFWYRQSSNVLEDLEIVYIPSMWKYLCVVVIVVCVCVFVIFGFYLQYQYANIFIISWISLKWKWKGNTIPLIWFTNLVHTELLMLSRSLPTPVLLNPWWLWRI